MYTFVNEFGVIPSFASEYSQKVEKHSVVAVSTMHAATAQASISSGLDFVDVVKWAPGISGVPVPGGQCLQRHRIVSSFSQKLRDQLSSAS